MSKKMNLNKLTMAFATAAQVPAAAPDIDVDATRAMVTKKVAEIKQKKSEAQTTKTVKPVVEPKVKAAAKVKEPKEPKAAKPAKVVAEGDDKLFTVAGCSTKKEVTKLRFANDLVARTKILDKDGHTDIKLFELPRPMSKAEIVEYFKANPELGIDATALFNKEDAINSGSKKSALTTPAK